LPICSVEEKFGVQAGEALREKLEKNRDYEVMPQCPDQKELWLYRVYGGIAVTKGVETKKTTGMTIRGKVAPDTDTAALAQMVADEMEEPPKLNDIHGIEDSSDTVKKGRGRRGAKGKGKGKDSATDVPNTAPKRVPRKKKEVPVDDGTPDHVKKARAANHCA